MRKNATERRVADRRQKEDFLDGRMEKPAVSAAGLVIQVAAATK